MFYRDFKPIKELKNYINSLWISKFSENDIKNQKTFADGSPEIVFKFSSNNDNLNPELLEQKYIIGEKTKYKEYKVNPNETFIGIKFKPGSLYSLVNLPMNEITDKSYILTLIDKKLFSSIERFNKESDFLNIIQYKLLNLFNKKKEINNTIKNAVNIIIAKKGKIDIKKLSIETCMSIRNLERKFMYYVGLTPKKLSCLIRFNNAYNYLIFNYFVNNKIDLIDTAITYGYYDQAHFNHDFKEFTGINPTSFFSSYLSMRNF